MRPVCGRVGVIGMMISVLFHHIGENCYGSKKCCAEKGMLLENYKNGTNSEYHATIRTDGIRSRSLPNHIGTCVHM